MINIIIPKRITLSILRPRCFSTKTPNKILTKSVLISPSKDIFTNLALEDWFYRHFDFSNHHILMLWQSDPCVVIGRHQNPWMEANVFSLDESSITLARRNSGGGTVFHDNGNLNLTFFTDRDHYKRRVNLELISKAVFNGFGVKLEINTREDLCLNDRKVSGTAAKLGRTTAYHHCTLLVNTDKEHLRKALSNNDMEIETTATKSVKSKIVNLNENAPEISIEKVMEAVRNEYLDRDTNVEEKSFQIIQPDSSHFPGLEELRAQFESWDWRYGKTPKFKVCRRFYVGGTIKTSDNELTVAVQVEKARILDVKFELNSGKMLNLLAEKDGLFDSLVGQVFEKKQLDKLDLIVRGLIDELFVQSAVERNIE